MFRPIYGHHQVDCLKFPLCNKFHYIVEIVTINLMMAMNWPKHVVG